MLDRLRRRLRALVRKGEMERELDEELRYHLEQEIERNVAGGMSPEEARLAALRSFGGVEQAKERCREARGVRPLEDLWQDMRYGLRLLRKNPGFTAVAVLTLTLGIGANTAIFSVVNAVLLRPLPYHDAEQLFTLWERDPKLGDEQIPPAAANFADWREQNRVFTQMAIYNPYRRFTLARQDYPERVAGAEVSASLFEVLGSTPARGRVFLPEEEQPGRDRVALISHGLWQRRFAADPRSVGQTIALDGKSYTVIGIMPEGFQFPGGSGTPPPAEVWVPLALDADAWRKRDLHDLHVIARLKPGTTHEQAEAEMNRIQQRLVEQYPDQGMGSHVTIMPLSKQVSGAVRPALLVLLGAVAFVLLIGCANVANLLLARAASRKKEVAVRSALGASRFRIVRQLLIESLLLACAGGIGGTLLATWGVGALFAIIPDNFPRREEIAIDYRVLGFTLLISALTGLIFGLAPALQSSKPDLSEALKEGGRSSSQGSFHGNRVRSLLVIAETALALMLLIGSALMIESFLRLRRVDPGFKTDRVLTMELSLPPDRYPQVQRAAFFQQLIERGKTLPGVLAVAAGKDLPLGGGNMNFSFDIEGRPFPPGTSPGADYRAVTPEYFGALGIPLVSGRVFGERDRPETPRVLIINEAMARRFFPGEDPVGKRVKIGLNNSTGEIVGVVGDVKHHGLDAEVRPEIYLLYAQLPMFGEMTMMIRTSGDPLSVIGAVRREISALDKGLPVSKLRTMDRVAAGSVAQPRFQTLLLGLFGVAALLLAAVGIYGVMSYLVAQRTHELGIRLALGAQRRDVMKLVVGQGMRLALTGVAVGLMAAFALTRLIESLLFGVSATDPLTFLVISLLLTVVALLACWMPARRAMRVDPLVALRYE